MKLPARGRPLCPSRGSPSAVCAHEASNYSVPPSPSRATSASRSAADREQLAVRLAVEESRAGSPSHLNGYMGQARLRHREEGSVRDQLRRHKSPARASCRKCSTSWSSSHRNGNAGIARREVDDPIPAACRSLIYALAELKVVRCRPFHLGQQRLSVRLRKACEQDMSDSRRRAARARQWVSPGRMERSPRLRQCRPDSPPVAY